MATIRKRGKTWYVDYYYKGKRHVKAISKHKRLAELALKDIEVKIAKKEHLGIHDPEKILFSTFADKYMAYSQSNKSPGSSKRDGVNLEHLKKMFGNLNLYELRPDMIEEYKQQRQEKVGSASINRELSTLKHMYTMAIQWGYVSQNPAKKVKLLKEPPGRVRYLSKEEIGKLLDACNESLKPIVITALNTGMRRGEIMELRWENVDLKERIIHIIDSKNNQSRMLPINNTLYDVLKQLPKENERVFGSNGLPRSITNAFRKAVKKVEIKDFRFHDLRHTFASYLAMSGCNLRTIQELLGHKNFQMTLRYAHLSQANLRDAVQRLVTIW